MHVGKKTFWHRRVKDAFKAPSIQAPGKRTQFCTFEVLIQKFCLGCAGVEGKRHPPLVPEQRVR